MNRNGFTLIEVMIVAAIIGILAAITIPQFQHLLWKSRNKARAEQGLPPLPEPGMSVNSLVGCAGTPVSISTDSVYVYKLYSSGCIEKALK